MFVVNYEVSYSENIADTEHSDNELQLEAEKSHEGDRNILQKIKLQNGLGWMRKRKQEAVMRTRRYKVYTEPEKYYHSKLLLYYPWTNEEQLINDSIHTMTHMFQNKIAYMLMQSTSMMTVNSLTWYLKT